MHSLPSSLLLCFAVLLAGVAAALGMGAALNLLILAAVFAGFPAVSLATAYIVDPKGMNPFREGTVLAFAVFSTATAALWLPILYIRPGGAMALLVPSLVAAALIHKHSVHRHSVRRTAGGKEPNMAAAASSVAFPILFFFSSIAAILTAVALARMA